jgi:hypothetical protein
MVSESVEENKTGAEQALRALYNFLRDYYFGNRIPWMHDILGTEFHQGRADALTGLALIPEVRKALDAIDEELGRNLEQWHGHFKPTGNQ